MKIVNFATIAAVFAATSCYATFAQAAENDVLFAQSNFPIRPGTLILLVVILVLHAIRTAKINDKIKEIEQKANEEIQAKIREYEALFEERVRLAALQMVRQILENAQNNNSSETNDAETTANDASDAENT